MIGFRVASMSRRVITVSFCLVLTLIPLVCNAGTFVPAVDAHGGAGRTPHAVDPSTPGHHADHAMVGGDKRADREFATTQPGCNPHHGHACCLVVARKPLREDTLDALPALLDRAICGEGIGVAADREMSLVILAAPPGSAALARINAPLLR